MLLAMGFWQQWPRKGTHPRSNASKCTILGYKYITFPRILLSVEECIILGQIFGTLISTNEWAWFVQDSVGLFPKSGYNLA